MLPSACPHCGLKLVREGERCPACASISAVAPPQATTGSVQPPVTGNTCATWPTPFAPPDSPLLAPPGYEVLAELGRGGMGVVYRAREVALRREVALKMVLAGVHASPTERARFRTEAESLAHLAHPGIVAIYEVGEHADRPFLCMEYCPGGNLEKRLGGAPLLPRLAALLVQKLALATEAAHQAKVIHRDLKPGNVLLTGEGEPRISDFGLARQLDDQGQTQTGTVMGTPSYMAPEQARGEKTIGPGADVYALGAVLYECLTGRPPFKAATTFDTLAQVLNDEPVAPTTLNAQVPRDLETVCLKCLRKEPAKRYAGAQALADDLGRWLAGEPIEARPVGRLERASKWVRRNPAVAALSSTIALLLVVGMVISTLFALEARREARRANDKADEAERERQTAEREKVKAHQALAEVERTLIEGLLRPIGKTGDTPGPAEIEALERLAALSDERRMRFLEVGLEKPESARNLARRAEWVAQAIVGLDAGRRERVVAVLTRRLHEPGAPAEVAVACALLGAQLEVRDATFLLRGMEVLTAADRDKAWDSLGTIRDGAANLMALFRGDDLLRAADALLASLDRPVRLSDHVWLVERLRALLERLPAAQAAPRARQAADRVVARFLNAPPRTDRVVLVDQLGELMELLAEADAGRLADQAAGELVGLLERHEGPGGLHLLCSPLRPLVSKLTAPALARTTEATLATLKKTKAPSDLDELAQLLERLFERMRPADRARQVARALPAFRAPLEQGPDGPDLLSLARSLFRVSKGVDDAAARAAVQAALRTALDKAASSEDLIWVTIAVAEDRSGDKSGAGLAAQAIDRVLASLEKTRRFHGGYRLIDPLARLLADLDRPAARKVAERLLGCMGRLTSPDDLRWLATAVRHAASRLPPGEAARFAGRAAERVTAALREGISASDLQSLGSGVAALRPVFAPGQEARYASALIKPLRKHLFQATGYELRYLLNMVQSLAPGLAPADATRASADVRALLFRQTGEDAGTLAEVLHALHERLGAEEARHRAAELAPTLTAAFARASTFNDVYALAKALSLVGTALPPADATRLAREALAATRASLPKVLGASNSYYRETVGGPTGSLTLLLVRLETPELVRLLGHPLATHYARQAVLNAIGLRTRMSYRNPHHLLDWAESNGVDLRTAGR